MKVGRNGDTVEQLTTMEHPRLLPKLRTALACLYSDGNGASVPEHRNEAHTFLLGFKSSNVRRAVTSRAQSKKDRVDDDSGGNGLPLDHLDILDGSVFLSCLALLLHRSRGDFRNHERIFAAQTLCHRCRSIKLVETLDLEAEDGATEVARLVLALEGLRAERARQNVTEGIGEKSLLNTCLERWTSLLARRCGGGDGIDAPDGDGGFCDGPALLALVLQRNATSLLADPNIVDAEHLEEQVKGTLLVLTITVAMYASAFNEYEEGHCYRQREGGDGSPRQPHQNAKTPPPWANSVLSDLGAALSVTALRVKYRPTADRNVTPPVSASCPSLIDMLANAVTAVRVTAEELFSRANETATSPDRSGAHFYVRAAHRHAVQRSIAVCLRALPETVLLSPGQGDGRDTTAGGHRIPSVDRASLQAASMELRTVGDDAVGTGMDRAWQVLLASERADHFHDSSTSLEGEAATSAARLLECCEAWARHVAVPIPVIEATVGPLVVRYLETPNQHRAQNAAFQYLIAVFDGASPLLTPKDILTAAMGLGSGGVGRGGAAQNNSHKCNVKKQGHQSRKRQSRRLGRAVAAGGVTAEAAAEEELQARRNAAVVAATAVVGVPLPARLPATDAPLRRAVADPSALNHGLCSTVAAAAGAVLPHLLALGAGAGASWRHELFVVITSSLCQMCVSPFRGARVLTYEPLLALHAALATTPSATQGIEQAAVNAICEVRVSTLGASLVTLVSSAATQYLTLSHGGCRMSCTSALLPSAHHADTPLATLTVSVKITTRSWR